MVKLLLCLLSAAVLAGAVLQLRQQRLELAYESAELHDQVRAQQSRLWNQQLLIAACTAPNAIVQTVGTHGLNLVSPPQPGPPAAPTAPAPREPGPAVPRTR